MRTNLALYSVLAVPAVTLLTVHLRAAPGDLDSLDANIVGHVLTAAVQRDGKIIIGGSFTSVLGVLRNNVARLNADGTLDTGFDLNLSVGAEVQAVALQPDSKVLLGGVNIRGTSSLGRFNVDGLLDASFDPNPNDWVLSMAVQADGKILLGGAFTALQPNGAPAATTRNYVARVNADGTLDAGFDPNPESIVNSLAVQTDGKVVLGGYFTTLQPNGAPAATTRNNLARVNADGTLDTSFDPNPNLGVICLAVQADGKVVLGGPFTSIQPAGAPTPTVRHYVARVNADGSLDAGFDPSPNGYPLSMALLADATMLLGGNFTAMQPNGAPFPQARSYLARINADGTLDTAFNPNPNGIVQGVAVQADGHVLISGSFIALQPNGAPTATARNSFARLAGYPSAQTLSIISLPRLRYELLWHRTGATPELTRATFELSQDGGATFGPPVEATRDGTSADWEILLLHLSGSGVWRARGYTGDGTFNGSSSIIEQLLQFGPDTRLAIPGLFNTGVDSAGTLLGLYDPDFHYYLPGPTPLQPAPIAVTAAGGFPIPPWVDYANPVSTWISPITLNGSLPGDFVYETTFDLTGMDPTTASLTGRWATDNTGEMLLNGVSKAMNSDFTSFTPFQIANDPDFQPGINTLTFRVNNAGTTANPTGLRVEVTGLADLCGSVPAAPTGVSASDGVYCGQVLITWNASVGATGYNVYRDGSLIGNTATLTLTDTPGNTSSHSYTVRATYNCGTGNASTPDNGYAAGPPAAPTGVSATDSTYCGVVRVSWNASAGATSYDVYRDGSYLTTVTASPYDDIPGNFSTHSYSVIASNGCGASGMSSADTGSEGNCAHLLVDDAEGGPYVQAVGGWSSSTSSAGYWATDYLHDGNAGKGSKSFTFIPTIQSAGAYEVFVWYTAAANRANNVAVDIIYSGGTTTVTVNEQANGSQWVSLGTRNFAAGRAGRVVVRTTGTVGFVIADAIKLVPTAPVAHLLVDDADGPTYFQTVGSWMSSSSSPGFWGSDYLHDGNAGKGTKTATFTPSVAAAGAYQVHIYYTAGANRASNLPVDIVYNGGTATVTVNERVNGSTWVLLGTYNFAAGNSGHVTLRTTGTDGYVIADAVKLVAAPPASHLVVDNADGAAYVQMVGGWTTSAASSGYWGTDYLHDANTGKGTKTVTFTPVVPSTGNYQVFIWFTAGSNRANNVPVDIIYNGGTSTVTVNEQTGGSAWVSLGTYNFAAGNSGHVTIRTTGTSGFVIADAIKLQ